jgi:hypothetical protein
MRRLSTGRRFVGSAVVNGKMLRQDLSLVIREFNLEVQQVAGQNKGSKTFSIWLWILPLPFGKGKQGKGLSDVRPSPPTLSQREREISPYTNRWSYLKVALET